MENPLSTLRINWRHFTSGIRKSRQKLKLYVNKQRSLGPKLSRGAEELGINTASSDSDANCDFKIQPDFKRFNQKDEVFCRSWWDKTIRTKKSEHFYTSYRNPLSAQWQGRGPGFSQRDFALRNASWHITDIFAELKGGEDRREGFLDELSVLRDGPADKVAFDSEEEASRNIKHVAEKFGADMAGITTYDERWTYSKKYSCATGLEKENKMEDDIHRTIVLIHSMDKDLLQTVPSALSGTATGLGYAKDLFVLLSLSQYLRNLGYKAVPSMNDTAISIPYAIKAGLGELGRHGLLITPKYGPRVRIGKIFTNLPMTTDKPIRFGVKDFCNICSLCVKACPAKAIFEGEPAKKKVTASTMQGVEKWAINPEKCFKYWTTINTDCSVCIRVCPYNRGSKWHDVIWRYLAGTFLRNKMLDLDVWMKRGKKLRPKDWWAGAFGHQNNT